MDRLGHMATFVRVVEGGSLSAAARSLGVSVPSVSRQMRALERDVGAPLMLRSTRRVVVTEGGRRFYERCLRILADVDAARQSVADGGPVGRLTVTAPVTLGSVRVAPHLPGLLASHPELHVDLRLEDRLVDLVAEGVDVAIRSGAGLPDSTSYVARHLFSFRRLLVASPAYLARRGAPRTPDALAGHEALVHLSATAAAGAWHLTRGGKVVVVPVRGRLRTNAVAVLAEAARAGEGLALLPDWLVQQDLRDRALVRVLPAYEGTRVDVAALCRVELRSSSRVRALVEHLAERRARR